MPPPLNMLEYLAHAGVDIQPLIDEKAIKKEYLRQIYRVDSRDKILDKKGRVVGKSNNPRHLH